MYAIINLQNSFGVAFLKEKKFQDINNNIWSFFQCADATCPNSCASDDIDCFVLDDHGYVIVGPDTADTGKFFGEVKAYIMKHLIDERIFKEVSIYDYQAVCFINKDSSNPASILITVILIIELVKVFFYICLFIFYNNVSPSE